MSDGKKKLESKGITNLEMDRDKVCIDGGKVK